MIKLCESPVEIALLQELRQHQTAVETLGYVLELQHVVGPYRLDFAFLAPGGQHLAVEVDGHEFHEKTAEQATVDRRRDRYLALGGWRVVRFTGTEVSRAAFTCAAEVLVHLQHLVAVDANTAVVEAVARKMLQLSKKTAEHVEDRHRKQQAAHEKALDVRKRAADFFNEADK